MVFFAAFAAYAIFGASTHHHLHADLSVDAVHEDVTVINQYNTWEKSNPGNLQLIEAPYWCPHGLPHGEEKADGGERFLAAGKPMRGPSVAAFSGLVGLDLKSRTSVLSIRKGLPSGMTTHQQIQCLLLVTGREFATEATLTEQIEELDARSTRDEFLEVPPAFPSVDKRRFEELGWSANMLERSIDAEPT